MQVLDYISPYSFSFNFAPPSLRTAAPGTPRQLAFTTVNIYRKRIDKKDRR